MPTAHSQFSALRYPLDRALATKGNVRVLRELIRNETLSAPKLVEITELANGTVREALHVLTQLKLVLTMGQGRVLLYQFNKKHPLGTVIIALFTAESHRMASILQLLREAAEELGDAVKSVWLYGSVARREDSLESDLDIAIISEPSHLATVTDHFTQQLDQGAETLCFKAEPVFINTDDLRKLVAIGAPWWLSASQDAITVYGAHPNELAAEFGAYRQEPD